MTALRDKPTPQETLAHHGVKGMKWGVRRDASVGGGGGVGGVSTELKRVHQNIADIHDDKVNAGIALNQRVANRTNTKTDYAKVALGSGAGRLLTSGVRGAAAKNAIDQQAHLDRLHSGNASVNDVLAKYGSLTLPELGKAALKGRSNV